MALAMDWQDAQLRSTTDLTPDIRLFEIVPMGGFVPPAPGCHITVGVLVDGRPDLRSYSVVGPCTDDVYRIAVKRMDPGRGGSAYLWGLEPGARLRIAGPRNLFELSRGRPGYLLVAGGIGITPIYGMALALADAGADLRLLYGARTAADLAFADTLRERLGDRLETVAEADGRVIDLDGAIAALPEGGEMYVCGPIGLLDEARRRWTAAGRPAGGLRFETFGNTGRYPAETFTVRIPRLNREITVPRNRTLLEALEESGIDMIFNCRRGECGLCAVTVLETEGEIDHRDVFFSDRQKAENRRMCTCVSRAVRGGITIDTADR
ncbi:PDR/VanB family oxidoreductase [Azospirillum halopraeferens]|uniref:PDR/VanB family oxidoreductase n=1 Tax=Azospirillum halopraeferens TaxID=34010 RepID=UPI0004177D61|nr:PDR/VanB family oxidoreductase [Azospirillum halopraeferens]